MIRMLEVATQLLVRPFGMTESFRRRGPYRESLQLFALVLLCVAGYLTGLLGAEARHALLGSFMTATGALVSAAAFIVVVFLLHVNALILGGDGRYLTLFATLLLLACALLLFVRLPLSLVATLAPLPPGLFSLNALFNLLVALLYLAYATVAVRSLYALPFTHAGVALCLLPLYAATVAASFKLGLRWFA